MKHDRYTRIYNEARRNPDQNPHVGAWDYLVQYKDDPDVYISFTDIDKIGINPQSHFNTPVGIYTYPLKEFVEIYVDVSFKDVEDFASDFFKESSDAMYKKSIGSYAPFAGNSKYVNFLKIKNSAKANFVNDMYVDYGSNDYDRDIKILEKNYNNIKTYGNPQLLADFLYKELMKEEEYISLSLSVSKYPKLRHHTIDSILLTAFGKTNEKFPDSENLLEFCKSLVEPFMSKDYDKVKNLIVDYIKSSNDGFSEIVEEGLATTKEKNPIMSMWNITRLLSTRLSSSPKQASTKWNMILSKDLGYSGFADKSGKGYIHPSEPMQAVFLNTKAFELLNRIENTTKKKQAKGVKPNNLEEFKSLNDVDILNYYKLKLYAGDTFEQFTKNNSKIVKQIEKDIKEPFKKFELRLLILLTRVL